MNEMRDEIMAEKKWRRAQSKAAPGINIPSAAYRAGAAAGAALRNLGSSGSNIGDSSPSLNTFGSGSFNSFGNVGALPGSTVPSTGSQYTVVSEPETVIANSYHGTRSNTGASTGYGSIGQGFGGSRSASVLPLEGTEYINRVAASTPGAAPEPERPTAPAVTSYAEAAERAQELYDEIQGKQTFYDETYGGLSQPERYWKYGERTEELETLKAEYQTILDYMVEHYKEMDAEPLFSFQGTLGTGDVYHQQAQDAENEAVQYRETTKGLPDPIELHELLAYAARMNKTLEGYDWTQAPAAVEAANREKSYLERSLNQILLGNYTEDVTLAGTAGQIGLGLLGLDLPADIRDLSYDLTRLKSTPWWQTGLDALAFLPVAGGLKYADETADGIKAANRAAEAAEGAADAAKTGGRTAESGEELIRAARQAGLQAGQAVAALEDGSKTAEAGIDMAAGALREGQKTELLETIASQLDDGIISVSSEKMQFNTLADPMREVTGAGLQSHPREIEAIQADLKESGASLIYREGPICYQPGISAGVPGQIVIDPEASYSAWVHEYTHFLDDKAAGFNGMRALENQQEWIAREVRAYDAEIELANKIGRQDIAERLEALKQEEVARIGDATYSR